MNPLINAPKENLLVHSRSDQVDSQDNNHIFQTKKHLAVKVAEILLQDKRPELAMYKIVPF